jgi:hypothetical protein
VLIHPAVIKMASTTPQMVAIATACPNAERPFSDVYRSPIA